MLENDQSSLQSYKTLQLCQWEACKTPKFTKMAGGGPVRWTLMEWLLWLQVLSIACCVFYSHCGNQVPQHNPTLWSPYPLSQESIKWAAGASKSPSPEGWNMQHVKSQVCWKWLAPVGSAKDYPVFSKWVVYGEVQNIIPFTLDIITKNIPSKDTILNYTGYFGNYY